MSENCRGARKLITHTARAARFFFSHRFGLWRMIFFQSRAPPSEFNCTFGQVGFSSVRSSRHYDTAVITRARWIVFFSSRLSKLLCSCGQQQQQQQIP